MLLNRATQTMSKNIMKILYLNRSDSEGGAAKGAITLLEHIQAQGAQPGLLVQRKSLDNSLIKGPSATCGKWVGGARRLLEAAVSGYPFGFKQGLFASASVPERLKSTMKKACPDIVHLHWVARMMRLETLRTLEIPIVWTLHDSWPFTGGCFLPGACERYREMCGCCPLLASDQEHDLSRKVWRRKLTAWRHVNLTLIAPSHWMRDCALASSLFQNRRVEVIPNGIDTRLFRPMEMSAARESLTLPLNKKLILFGAKSATTDPNKGFQLLTQALREVAQSKWHEKVELIVFGDLHQQSLKELNIKTHVMGWQNDAETLSRLYASADLFVLPSLQENLPYTVMEAMACGTPCVAFDQGGVPDLIEHHVNGYLANAYDTTDLARGIGLLVENESLSLEMGTRSRHKVEQQFDIEEVAKKHIALYVELLNH